MQVGLFVVLLAVVAALTIAIAQRSGPVAIAQEETTVTGATVELPPVPEGDLLLFASADPPALLAAPASSIERGAPIPPDQVQQLIQWGVPVEEHAPTPAGTETEHDGSVASPEEVEGGHDGLTLPGSLFSSPDGRYAAVQLYPGPMAVVLLVDLADRNKPVLSRLTPEGFGRFLGWHPDSRHALYVALDLMVSDPGLWIVDVVEGTHQRIETPGLVAPEGLTAAAFSPDGTTVVYATHGAWAQAVRSGLSMRIASHENFGTTRSRWLAA
ncbi:MAG: hypothetical protein DCC55_34275 [Chloroflexi bacterium]|nr:MAG: hypothetical protein DCC55_34275 [Chloroflexota bacterium]